MMRTILSKILIASVILVNFTACDFLDEESETKYTAQYVYETEEGLGLAVTSLYALDRNYQDQNEGSVTLALRRATDVSVTNGGTGNFYGAYDPNYLKPSAAQPKDMWQGMYNIIGKCNDIIEAAKKLPETENLNNLIAQAKAYRAQSYFLLYRTFDRIWLNTVSTTPDNVNDKRVFKPATKDEVFELLYDDLGFAIKHLEWKPADIGRFNQAAARHIMADVALWNEDWQLVLDQIDAIENSGAGYELVAVDKIFNSENLNHSEALLVQQWSRNPGGNLSNGVPKGHYYAAWYIAPYRTTFGGDQYCSFENWAYGWGRCYPSPYLFSLYDQKVDKRYKAFYIHQYKNTTDKTIRGVKPGEYMSMINNGSVDKNLYPGCIKYGDIWTRTTTEQRSYKDIIIYRLAETYIMAAEAAVRLGNNDLAKKYYNKTWMRAGNQEFTGTVTLQNVIDEQARELALEGQRWYFLKRLDILIDQVKKYAGDPRISTSIVGRVNLPKNPHFVRWPIPENEVINMGPENFPQNEGYN
ncbi:SusD-like protein [Bacteroides salyersiae]|nr:SusD-like protein [Bacteroides salyersiae]